MEILGKINPPPRRSDSDPPRRRLHERRLKAVAVLPSLATLGNLLCGLGAIYMCLLSYDAGGADLATRTLNSPRIEWWFPTYAAIGCYLLLLAAAFDALDGRLARLTRRTTEFGAQLDTLADIVSFGVAPALLAMCVVRPLLPLAQLGEPARLWWRVEWALLAGYVCCAALRLARFNVENEEDESSHLHFKGLPSPGAAAALIGLVLVHEDIIRASGAARAAVVLSALLPWAALALGLLMVSRLRYYHLINAVLRGRRPFRQLVLIFFVLLIGGLSKPQLTFALAATAYAAGGPTAWLLRRLRPPAGTLPAGAPQRAADAEKRVV